MHLAHIGLAVVVVGITMVKGYELERDVRMGVGDTVTLRQYVFELKGVQEIEGPNYKALRADVAVTRNGQKVTDLAPEKRMYFSSRMPMTEAAIDSGLTRDLYVSMGEMLEGGSTEQWSVRVYFKPFVFWLWGGAMFMVLGGLIAALDRRYRRTQAARKA